MVVPCVIVCRYKDNYGVVTNNSRPIFGFDEAKEMIAQEADGVDEYSIIPLTEVFEKYKVDVKRCLEEPFQEGA